MDEVNTKINAITEKRLHLIETSIDEGRLLSSPEFAELLNKCKVDWEAIAENFDDVESDEKRQILVWGMGSLDAADYASFLEKIVTKFEAGEVVETVIEEVLSPHGRMQAFVVDNHAHVRIANLLSRIKTKAVNADFKSSLDDIISGADKTALNDYRDGHQGLPQGNIPKVLLAE